MGLEATIAKPLGRLQISSAAVGDNTFSSQRDKAQSHSIETRLFEN